MGRKRKYINCKGEYIYLLYAGKYEERAVIGMYDDFDTANKNHEEWLRYAISTIERGSSLSQDQKKLLGYSKLVKMRRTIEVYPIAFSVLGTKKNPTIEKLRKQLVELEKEQYRKWREEQKADEERKKAAEEERVRLLKEKYKNRNMVVFNVDEFINEMAVQYRRLLANGEINLESEP